jgi:hypothetical protein
MRIRVSDASATDELIDYLESRIETVVERVNDQELEVALLGSYNADAMQMELYLRIRAWEAARRAAGVQVEITR